MITLHLVERYRKARPEVPISFSAGVDSRNFADCAALGFTPITACTDLLRPGGYARLPAYLQRLEERMRMVGAPNLGDYVLKADGQAEAAVARLSPDARLRESLLGELRRPQGDLQTACARAGAPEAYARLVQEAALLNTPGIVARATADPRYRADAHRQGPRKIGSMLWLFDCISCDKCVPVCPNDANFV